MKEQFALAMKDQRNFLHDLSNQLLITQGMASASRRMLESVDGLDEKVLIRLDKSIKAADRMIDLLQEQREKILKVQAENKLE